MHRHIVPRNPNQPLKVDRLAILRKAPRSLERVTLSVGQPCSLNPLTGAHRKVIEEPTQARLFYALTTCMKGFVSQGLSQPQMF